MSEILGPQDAVFSVKESLYDAADERAALIATVHGVGQGSAANVWLRRDAGVNKVLPERVLPTSEPDLYILCGEALRLAQVSLEAFGIDEVREVLVKKGLFNAAEAMLISSLISLRKQE